MAAFDTFECEQCGESFRALQGAKAAETGYCNPACETVGKGL